MSIEELENLENSEEKANSENLVISTEEGSQKELHNVVMLSGMFKNWFLDYASYVILERAVPHIYDGLKPVHRRILHAMKRLDDGRYNKVANIIGYTMQYHPHGDASIGDALVQLGQKDLLIDMQGNWGNILTGDSAAAPRYIEARLSKFALEVVFNPKTTFWKLSYDGRNKEPITLPVKFPLLLTLGVEGIAVGLSSKILPHNFNELIDACICSLEDKPYEIFPDFPTGGLADFSRYNDGLRGGSVKVRAKISKIDPKTLVITEVPFGKTTDTLIESIVKANEKEKIKIKKIDDNTAEFVEILIHLAPGISADKTIDALFAFTDCETSISPNSCVIEDNKPRFVGVAEMVAISAQNTVELLRQELQIRRDELDEEWHFSSLEKIFIENRIYIKIEDCETWESVIETIDKALKPFRKLLQRDVTRDDIVNLTEIKIKRISKFDAFKADELIKSIEEEIKKIDTDLANIIPYTINYYRHIKKKYGAGRERKTEIRSFDTIEAAKVVVANEKLYVNREEGFFGTSLKKDEFVCECSDIDDIIVFRKDGKYVVSKVSEKSFVGKNIIHISVFNKNDERTIYNSIYRDGKYGSVMVKRFAVVGVTRDKEYDISKGTADSKVLYFSANPNGEAETLKVFLKPRPKLKKLLFEFDFSALDIKGRGSIGNILTKHEVHKIQLKEQGVSTLGGRAIWYDPEVLRLNADQRGKYLGEFSGSDRILVISNSGYYKLYSFDLTNHFEEDIIYIEKYNPNKIFSAIHYDGEQGFYYLKRFQIEESDKPMVIIAEHSDSKLHSISFEKYPRISLTFGGKHSNREEEIVDVHEFIGIKGFKARGKRLSTFDIKNMNWLEPLIKEIEPDEIAAQTEEGQEMEFELLDDDVFDKDINPDDIKQMTLDL